MGQIKIQTNLTWDLAARFPLINMGTAYLCEEGGGGLAEIDGPRPIVDPKLRTSGGGMGDQVLAADLHIYISIYLCIYLSIYLYICTSI